MIESMWTIATPFSNKPHVIPLWLAAFDALQLPRAEFKLLWVDISGNPHITRMLQEYISLHGHKFAETQLLINPPKQFSPITDFIIHTDDQRYAHKRQSVAETMNIINLHRKGHLLLWEDDVIPPSNAFMYMKQVFDQSDVCNGVASVQYQRVPHAPTEILAFNWDVLLLDGRMHYVARRLLEKSTGIEPIGASSSGFVLYRDTFLNEHTFYVQGPYGQDIMTGFRLNGFNKFPFGGHTKLLMCWNIKCVHIEADIYGNINAYKSPLCNTNIPTA